MHKEIGGENSLANLRLVSFASIFYVTLQADPQFSWKLLNYYITLALGLPDKACEIKELVFWRVLFTLIPRVFGKRRRYLAPLSYPWLVHMTLDCNGQQPCPYEVWQICPSNDLKGSTIANDKIIFFFLIPSTVPMTENKFCLNIKRLHYH